MHTTTRPAAPAQEQQETAAPARRQPLGFDARMTATVEAMGDRCRDALLQLGVDSAMPETRLDLADIVRTPLAPPAVEPEIVPYATPAAATLHRAARRLAAGGWCRGALVDADGARCLYGAVHAEAPGSAAERDAMDVLLEAIRARWPDAETVPTTNDHRLRDGTAAVQLLDTAARVADARGI